MAGKSIAARNNNPLNIRPGQPYEGLATPSQVGGFANFVSAPFGFRAVFLNYIHKADRGINTIRKLISEWAPPSDGNDTESYIATVAKKTGYGSDETINLKTWEVGSKVCYAQTEVETGEPFENNFTVAQMAEGAFRAGIVDAPPTLAARAVQVSKTVLAHSATATVAASASAAVSAAQAKPHSPSVAAALFLAGLLIAAYLAYQNNKK